MHTIFKMQGKFWTVTKNNYTDADILEWSKAIDNDKVAYLCFQKEVAPTTGTPHLQGYIVFTKRLRLPGVKKILGPVHALRSNGTPSQNRDYCKKSESAIADSFQEFGEIPSDPQRGKRTDFDDFKNAVSEGLRCKREARDQFPELVAKFPRYCYDILDDQQDIQVEDHELFPWQLALKNDLLLPADDRKIIFVIDKQGGQGKTWFAKHYCKLHSDAQYMEPAKKVDMAYALLNTIRVLFLNITRTTESDKQDYLYSFIESVKDGMVFSPKYESRMKYLGKVHVVVMMNQDPNMELLSNDRYSLINLI